MDSLTNPAGDVFRSADRSVGPGRVFCLNGSPMATDMQTNELVQAALEYAGYGWRVVPLHNVHPTRLCSCHEGRDCATPGKHPRAGEGWHKLATADEEQIIAWWDRWPSANVGVQMGERSGIVDFEYDTEEEKEIFFRIFDGSPPAGPVFESSRGKHHLFRWRPDLPGAGVHSIGKLKIRIGNNEKGSQSVFPPSMHQSGKQYTWLASPSQIEVPDLSDAIIAKLWNWDDGNVPANGDKTARSAADWTKLLSGTTEGSRNEDMAAIIGRLLYQSNDLESEASIQILYESALAINERNRPPLKEKELRSTFTSILKREQNRRLTEEVDEVLKKRPEDQVGADLKPPKQMRLVIVDSDPPRYELYAPQFAKAESECLVLTAEQMVSPKAIKIQALKQAEYPLPFAFEKAWKKQGGLYERLIFNAEHRRAPLEEQRLLVVADRIQTRISKPRILEDGQQPDPKGRPCQLANGTIVFGFNAIWEDMKLGPDRIERGEVTKVLRKIGAKIHWLGNVRLRALDQESLATLARMIRNTSDD